MTNRPASLDIVAGSRYLSEQESLSRQHKDRLAAPIAVLWLVTILIGLTQLILFLFAGMPAIYFAVTGLLAILSLTGIPLLPHIDRHQARERNFATGRKGEEQLAAFLHDHLDSAWTLHRNLLLPDGKGDIDALLLGPQGLLVLEVKAWSGVYRNVGKTWQRRNSAGAWYTVDGSPSAQALWNARRLEAFLRGQGVLLPVQPRVVWAGPGRVHFTRPAVPIWLLAKPSYILADLEKAGSITPDVLSQVASFLCCIQP